MLLHSHTVLDICDIWHFLQRSHSALIKHSVENQFDYIRIKMADRED